MQTPILLLGSTGQLGATLSPELARIGKLIVTDRAILDLSNTENLRQVVHDCKPSVIVNAAAYTAVDKAESEQELAHAVNAAAPATLARAARETDAILIHYSTDYVFDGSKASAYIESDPVNPLNAYGRTKAEGEVAVQKSGCRHLIFRTSWVYSERGSNFLLTMLRLARQRNELRIVNDQLGAPTSTHSLALATAKIIRRYSAGRWPDDRSGLYHMTDSGSTSWFGFAKAILERASKILGIRVPRLIPITSAEYPTAARRPINSILNCEKLKAAFEISMPNWESSLDEVLTDIVAQQSVSSH
ncbi:MAG TPA: dTDP-4-dehydrorhamnose reductase [Terriglobales bacterium]|nr:dTDP-4-dehydrorhamnose reductase [Terriglobales bacterium]